MTLSDQCALLLSAIDIGLLRAEDIVEWADRTIVELQNPPAWIIDLSTSNAPHIVDFVSRLRWNASVSLSLRSKIQIVILAYEAGLLAFREALPKLFKFTLLERGPQPLDALDERLADALVEWDCQDDPSIIDEVHQSKMTAIFEGYLSDAQEVQAVLPKRFAVVHRESDKD